MKAIITGITSGIGFSISRVLSDMGYEIIGIGRDINKLKNLQETYGYTVHKLDLSNRKDVINFSKDIEDVDILVNCAGFGDYGLFHSTSLDKDLSMIEVNLVAYHILTKEVLKKMINKNSGYILNVSSSASFTAGALMGTYYSTKAYVTCMTESIYEELKRTKSNVHISALCPGAVDTNFNKDIGISFSTSPCSSMYVAKYAIKKMFKNKLLIIPTFKIKLAYLCSKFLPLKFILRMNYYIQQKKK